MKNSLARYLNHYGYGIQECIYAANIELWKEKLHTIFAIKFIETIIPNLTLSEKNQITIDNSHFNHTDFFN
jgi:hypothetical protein